MGVIQDDKILTSTLLFTVMTTRLVVSKERLTLNLSDTIMTITLACS